MWVQNGAHKMYQRETNILSIYLCTFIALYAFFWVIPRRLYFICHMAYKDQTPGNYPKESIQHSGQGGSLKSRILV